MTSFCPCKSSIPYSNCCQRYHLGSLAENALILMRSRYSAYAMAIASYIIETTHPNHPAWTTDHKRWTRNILNFSKSTDFKDLKILEFLDGESEAFVTFRAILRQAEKDASFTERSRFLKVDGRWLYISGEISNTM